MLGSHLLARAQPLWCGTRDATRAYRWKGPLRVGPLICLAEMPIKVRDAAYLTVPAQT
jgi:hypothetical protein